MKTNSIRQQLKDFLAKQILILDGAFGTEIKKVVSTDRQYEFLNINNPDSVKHVHVSYIKAGANIITTNSFGGSPIELKDFCSEDEALKLCSRSAIIAKEATQQFTHKVFVAGSVGPTSHSLMFQEDVSYDELLSSFKGQIKALVLGGVDIILLETFFDILNVRAAAQAYLDALDELSISTEEIPLMVSITLTEQGRILTGHSVKDVWDSIKHADPISFGLNCGFGIDKAIGFISQYDELPVFVSMHPNAGLPDDNGNYSIDPDTFAFEASKVKDKVNILGGCCGTTPKHIACLCEIHHSDVRIPHNQTPSTGLTIIGERCNVSGSAKFKKLILSKNYDEAVEIAEQQIEKGANIIDLCFDNPDLDALSEMFSFESRLKKSKASLVPWMLDSSVFDVLEQSIKDAPISPLINSLSLKEGEEVFIERMKRLKNTGCSVVLMLADEKGQADKFERKIQIAERLVKLSTNLGFSKDRILIDPNVLTICTGVESHRFYGRDFINATERIKSNLGVSVSGGISNLSFAFRGNTRARNILNSVFVHLASEKGLTHAIISPSSLLRKEDIPQDTYEKAILAIQGESDGSEFIDSILPQEQASTKEESSLEQKLFDSIKRGNASFADELSRKVIDAGLSFDTIVNSILMPAMISLGDDFEKGKAFLPSLIKASSAMNVAMKNVSSLLDDSKQGTKKVVIATVYGDVHDIGKNIVATLLRSSGFLVEDLGIQVPSSTIVEHSNDACAVCLSGLITPSLTQMIKVLEELNKVNITVPVIVGGAATSKLHTALKMAPVYKGPVEKAATAVDNANLIDRLSTRQGFIELKERQEAIRRQKTEDIELVPFKDIDRTKSIKIIMAPLKQGTFQLEPSIAEIEHFIDWSFFFYSLQFRRKFPEVLEIEEARIAFNRAKQLLVDIAAHDYLKIQAKFSITFVKTYDDHILLDADSKKVVLPMLRNQTKLQDNKSIVDFIGKKDYLSVFALTAGVGLRELISQAKSPFDAILYKLLADRLAEATAEWLHLKVRSEYWCFDSTPFTLDEHKYKGRRMCFGYAACPDHSVKRQVFDFLEVEKTTEMRLTDSFMITPEESLCGLFTCRGDYFSVGKVGDDQLEEYSKLTGLSVTKLKEILPNNIK